jgi:hypothetical protein
MGLAACDDDEIALSHAELLPMFEREGGCATTEIMEQGVGALRQGQVPGMTELEVKEQGPAQSNAIEHFGEDVHAPDVSPPYGRTQYPDDRGLTSRNPSYYFVST